jgi:hypothetical protein
MADSKSILKLSPANGGNIVLNAAEGQKHLGALNITKQNLIMSSVLSVLPFKETTMVSSPSMQQSSNVGLQVTVQEKSTVECTILEKSTTEKSITDAMLMRPSPSVSENNNATTEVTNVTLMRPSLSVLQNNNAATEVTVQEKSTAENNIAATEVTNVMLMRPSLLVLQNNNAATEVTDQDKSTVEITIQHNPPLLVNNLGLSDAQILSFTTDMYEMDLQDETIMNDDEKSNTVDAEVNVNDNLNDERLLLHGYLDVVDMTAYTFLGFNFILRVVDPVTIMGKYGWSQVFFVFGFT